MTTSCCRFTALVALAALTGTACSRSAASEPEAAAAAPAPASPIATTWTGHGAVVGLDGEELSLFDVTVTERHLDDQRIEIRGEVTLADGRRIPIEQERIGSEQRFRLETNQGTGGGLCFGEGLCQTYEDVGGGKAFASTLVVDGGRLRILTTELAQGRAVRFTRQTLTKSE
jgi:hypothetical protein